MLILAAHKESGMEEVKLWLMTATGGGWEVAQWDRASLLTFCRMQKVSWEIIANMRRETSGNEEITSQRETGGREGGMMDKKISCGMKLIGSRSRCTSEQSKPLFIYPGDCSRGTSTSFPMCSYRPLSSSTYCAAGGDRCPVATLGTVSKTCRAADRPLKSAFLITSPSDSRGCSASDRRPLTSITPHQRHHLTRRATAEAPTAPRSCSSGGRCG